ncbi:predicted protein [Streptomyces sp. AA4]|nr:predicted protein [Streptomyces sp. AA4]
MKLTHPGSLSAADSPRVAVSDQPSGGGAAPCPEPDSGCRESGVPRSRKGRKSVARRRRESARGARHARPGEPFTNNSRAPETLARTAEIALYQHFYPQGR